MAGKRINLSDLADEPVLEDARVPTFVDSAPRTARLDQVAPNPMNTRDVHADPEKIANIAESMRLHGQLQPCAVVTRAAFLAIFPEYQAAMGSVAYVQITGGRRYAAAALAGLSALDITIKNALAESRAQFIGATAAENIDREDYDPVEEALAVQLLVQECGSGKAAAERLARTPPWVTQRLNLLKLIPEIQALVRAGEMPLREVRTLHQLSVVEQSAALTAWRKAQEPTGSTAAELADDGDAGRAASTDTPSVRIRLSPAASAIRRLGGTPDKIAESLRAELPRDDLKRLAEELLRDA